MPDSNKAITTALIFALAALALPHSASAMPDTVTGQDRHIANQTQALDRYIAQIRKGREPTDTDRRITQSYFYYHQKILYDRFGDEFPEPHRTAYYLNNVKLSFINPKQNRNWPFGTKLSLSVKDEIHRRLEQKYDPFIAFASLFPALVRKENDYAIATFEKLKETDPFLATTVIEWSATRYGGGFKWLFDHYEQNDQQSRIFETIEALAATGVDDNLLSAAVIYVNMNKQADALEFLHQIKDPYRKIDLLTTLYARHHTATDAAGNTFVALFCQLRDELFPNGVEKVTLASFNGPPKDGVIFLKDSQPLRNAGLKSGNILVAVDGSRVTNAKQYSFALRCDPYNEKVTLIFWDGKNYREVHARVPNRHFEATFDSYEP